MAILLGIRQAERAIQEAQSRAMDADRWYRGGCG